MQLDSEYHNRYQDVLKQINTENAMAEEVRQYNEKMAEEKRQYNETLAEQKRQHNESLALQKEQFAWQKEQASKKSSGGSYSGSGGSGGSKSKSQSTTKTKNQTIKKNNTSSALPKATVKSLMALGEGPLSAASVAKKVAKGEVIEAKNKTGDTVFVKNQKQLPELLFRTR